MATTAPAQPRPIHRHGLASALMLLTTFFWASNIVTGKMALAGFSSLALAQIRMAATAILYVALYLAWRGLPRVRLSRRQWLLLALAAFTGITLNQIFYIGGLARTSVTHAGLIQAVGPVIVLLLAGMMKLEALTLAKGVGMAISFIGVAALLVEKPPQGTGAHWQGDALLLAASAVFAYYTILMKEFAGVLDTLTLNALVFVLGTILLIPICVRSTEHVKWASVPAQAWWGFGFMVLFGSLISYLIYGFALQELSASNVASFSYLQPIMAAALGVWLVGERITGTVVLGGVLILLGCYVAELGRGQKKHLHHLATGKV
ncbi:MAG: DMT family transporter [Terriglobia bacterium]